MHPSLQRFASASLPVLVLAALCLESRAFAMPQGGEPPSAASGEYTLTGIVVNSVTDEPVRGALVQVLTAAHKLILTGSDGKFRVEGGSTMRMENPSNSFPCIFKRR